MNKILATVGGMPIYEEDVNEFLAGLGQRGQGYNNPEGRKIILEQLIGNKLLLLDAKRNLIEAEPAFKEQLAKLKDNLLVNYAADKVVSAVAPATDADAKKFYDENCLIEQAFIKDDSKKICELLKAGNATIAKFAFFVMGEGLEKKSEDLSEEVAKQVAAMKN